MSEFEPFPKLARLSRECVVTEKIDGTNAQVYITNPAITLEYSGTPVAIVDGHEIFAGSRTRYLGIGPKTDNYGFAQWVHDNALELVKLGPGRHFGEWWGRGIQRNYGLAERRFSLFHTHGIQELPSCVSVVPTLYTGTFDSFVGHCPDIMDQLKETGSRAAPGFMDPEGIVVFHEHAKVAFKKTFDDKHKEAA